MDFPSLGRNAKTQSFILDRISSDDGEECCNWPYGTDTGGYGRFNFLGTYYNAHRIICRAVNGEPLNKEEVAHVCGNRLCCNKKHLVWVSRKENHSHKRKHGTLMRGEKVPTSKLKKDQVHDIRIALSRGARVTDIARAYGMSQPTISNIKSGKTWRMNV